MQRTAAATSCIRATSDRVTRLSFRRWSAGLALVAGLGVFAGSAAAQNRPAPAGDQNRVLLDVLNQVEGLGRQVRELRGQVEDHTNRIEQVNDRAQKAEKRQSDLYNDTDARARRLEQQAKDDVADRKKLGTQLGDIELRLKKLEADIDVQMKKLEAELEARFRKVETASAAGGGGDLEARLKRLEQAGASGAMPSDLDARLKKLEAAGGPGADVEARIRRLEQWAMAAPAEAVPGSAATPVVPTARPATPPVPTPPVPAAQPEEKSPVRLYEQALARQRAGDSAGATHGFQTFLKQFPRHELAPNAQYWMGEAFFRLGDYPGAIAAQQKLMTTYPDHLKVPDAMLILANAQNGAGDTPGARKTLEDLINRHPLSEAADKAKQRLAKLK